MNAEVMTSPPHAARENASRMATAIIAKAIVLRADFPKLSETTLCSTNKAGRIRNAPRTLGSLKVPRARPYSVRRSRPPGTSSQQQKRDKCEVQPQAGSEENDSGGQRNQFVRARLDGHDRAACANEPHESALQSQHTRRGSHRGGQGFRCCRICHHFRTVLSRRFRFSISAREGFSEECRDRTELTNSRCNTDRTRHVSVSSPRCRLRRASR